MQFSTACGMTLLQNLSSGLSCYLPFRAYQKLHMASSANTDTSNHSVQPLSHVWLFATPWTAAHQASLSITNSRNPPKPMSIGSVMPINRHILCRPLLLPPSVFPRIRVFSNESVLQISPFFKTVLQKYRSFSFSISSSNDYSGLISFRMD